MFFNKKLNKEDLNDYQAIIKILAQESFKYQCIKNNTVQIPKGRALAEQQFAVLGVLQQTVQDWISQILTKYGCEKGYQYKINSETGKITKVESTHEIIPQELLKEQKI